MTDFETSLDVRIVLKIFVEKGIVLSLTMDESAYYKLGDDTKQRSRNRKLTDWSKQYIKDLR